MRNNIRIRTLISFVLAICLLALAGHGFGKKGEKNFKRGMQYRGGPAVGQGRPGVHARGCCRPVEYGVSAPFPAREFQRFANVHAAGTIAR